MRLQKVSLAKTSTGTGAGFRGSRVRGFQGFAVSGFRGFSVSGFLPCTVFTVYCQGFKVSGFKGF